MKLSYNDKKHAYWLDGKRCKGVTSVASYPDDRYAIEQWRSRLIVIGCASSPPLIHRATAHFDERDKIQDIAEEAMAIAKANEASGRGTANHRIVERVDLGLEFIDTPEHRAIEQAWTEALDRAGLDVVPEYVERIVVYPDQLICGRFDRYCRRRSDGRLVCVDVKTGENAVKYPHSTTIQLALYTHAPLIAGPLQRSRDSEWTTIFEPLPDVDPDVGYVVYLPPEGPGRVFRYDIAAGWEAAQQICFPTVQWRWRDDLVEEIAIQITEPDPQQAYLDLLDRTEWVRDRVQAIKDAGHADTLAIHWSHHIDIPTFPKGGPTTHQHVDAIAAICDAIEAEHGLPFGPVDPTIPTPTKSTRKATA